MYTTHERRPRVQFRPRTDAAREAARQCAAWRLTFYRHTSNEHIPTVALIDTLRDARGCAPRRWRAIPRAPKPEPTTCVQYRRILAWSVFDALSRAFPNSPQRVTAELHRFAITMTYARGGHA